MGSQIIPYGRQQITEEDIAAVVEVLGGDYLTQGPAIPAFEQAFAEYIGARYAVSVSNGTAALHLCAMAMNLQPGQRVITTPITFAASANCIRYCGGEVVFVDIDPETYLLDIKAVRNLLESAPRGTYAGIIPVDFAGRAVDLESFRALADEHGLWIIEDSCHSPGGFYRDSTGKRQQCGNGMFADCAIFSFHPVKHIATGEGGMITTNDKGVYERLHRLRTHGITRDASRFTNDLDLAYGKESHPEDYPGWYMEMEELGYNYRLTDFQAALGLSQMRRAEDGLFRRRTIAARYRAAFRNIPGIIDRNVESDMALENGHAHHLYVIEVPIVRNELYKHLRTQNIFAQVHYIPTHLMPYYRQQGWKPGDLPHAEAYYRSCISLPMYPSLSDEELQSVLKCVCGFFKET
jgi:UDP-4-amino-4,6-dideoxy-N-acetyl-beta-L-altrosamine transaminase